MNLVNLDDQVELEEFLEQVNYALSLEFKEKWRHRYSDAFISIFQGLIIDAFQNQKPVKRSVMENQYTKKHGYDPTQVRDFLKAIDVRLYYPIVY
jgi:hypothetical protein